MASMCKKPHYFTKKLGHRQVDLKRSHRLYFTGQLFPNHSGFLDEFLKKNWETIRND